VLGLFYQLAKDRKNSWIVALLFILTGVAIVVYLNQPPYQPRERDYAYAGSFYAFAIWIGLGVPALYDAFKKRLSGIATASVITLASLAVPVLMAAENWDDHDRSNRYSARDLAYNYLNSCDEQAILVTHGDNDTFPLWYIQEVEGVRTDVRIMNTSLLGTDWYIDQMKYKTYESEPVKLSIPKKDYLYGTNDMIHVVDRINKPVPIKAVIDLISNPDARIQADNGKKFSFIASRQLLIPVNVKNALACGIVSEADSAQIQSVIQLNIPEGKNALTKCEMMILDMLANYEWDRPIYFVSMGGELELGLRDYLEYDGFAYKFVPIKSSTSLGSPGRVLPDAMYDRCMNIYKWGNLNDPKVYVDYQNLLTFNALMSGRSIYTTTARSLMENGKAKEAVAVLDKMQEYFIPSQFPLNCSLMPSLNEISIMEAIEIYIMAGERKKGVALVNGFMDETYKALDLFSKKYKGMYLSKYDIEQNLTYILHLADILKNCGEEKLSTDMEKKIEEYLNALQG
jgi:hypothetical protein